MLLRYAMAQACRQNKFVFVVIMLYDYESAWLFNNNNEAFFLCYMFFFLINNEALRILVKEFFFF